LKKKQNDKKLNKKKQKSVPVKLCILIDYLNYYNPVMWPNLDSIKQVEKKETVKLVDEVVFIFHFFY
jgi:HKD family nuclease